MSQAASEEAISYPVRALPLAELRGNRVTIDLLSRLRRINHLSPALLLDGPQGCGKRTIAMALAKALLCHQPTADGDSCGDCVSCTELAAGVHPDCLLLPDDRELPILPVEVVRESIVNAAAESALLGHGRIFILPMVERLRPEAANALLKVLEEPPPATHIIMTSSKGDGLLPTIRSRAQRFRLQALSRRDLESVLIGQGLSGAELSAALGQPGASLRSAAARDHLPPLAALMAIIGEGYDALAIADLVAQLTTDAEGFSGNTPTARQRNCLRWWLDAAIEDQRRSLVNAEPQRCLENIQALIQARHDIAVNITPRLVLEALALGPT